MGASFLALILAHAALSNALWGYPFWRPSVPGRLLEAKTIRAVSLVDTSLDPNGSREFVEHANYTIREGVSFGAKYPYDSPLFRALVALAERDLLPREPARVAQDRLTATYHRLERLPGFLLDVPQLRGTVIEYVSRDGKRETFVGVQGQQISNDHYPYYEAVFSSEPDSSPLSTTRFYFDIAGLEFLEGWVLFGLLTAVALITAATAAALWFLGRAARLIPKRKETAHN